MGWHLGVMFYIQKQCSFFKNEHLAYQNLHEKPTPVNLSYPSAPRMLPYIPQLFLKSRIYIKNTSFSKFSSGVSTSSYLASYFKYFLSLWAFFYCLNLPSFTSLFLLVGFPSLTSSLWGLVDFLLYWFFIQKKSIPCLEILQTFLRNLTCNGTRWIYFQLLCFFQRIMISSLKNGIAQICVDWWLNKEKLVYIRYGVLSHKKWSLLQQSGCNWKLLLLLK